MLNDLFHIDVRWPLFHGRGEMWREESFEFRFLNLKNGIISAQLEMFGSSDGVQSSKLTKQKFKTIRELMITGLEFRLIGKRETSTGFTVDTLGLWDFSSDGAKEFVNSLDSARIRKFLTLIC